MTCTHAHINTCTYAHMHLHPIITLSQHTHACTHQHINTPYHPTPVNTPKQNILSTHSFNTPYHHTLSTHHINPPHQHTSYKQKLSSHPLPPPRTGRPFMLQYDVLNIDHWRPFFGARLPPPSGGLRTVQTPIEYTNTTRAYALNVELGVMNALKKQIPRCHTLSLFIP